MYSRSFNGIKVDYCLLRELLIKLEYGLSIRKKPFSNRASRHLDKQNYVE